MILVTIGLSHFGFDRLIRKMDEIALKIDEKVVIQSGSSDYEPANSEYFKFTDRKHMDKLYSDCRILITHAGTGSIINSIKRNIMPMVVPRLSKYNEAFDDHQVEIAEEFSRLGYVVMINDLDEIYEYLLQKENKFNFALDSNKDPNYNLVLNLKSYINSLE